MVNIYWLKYCIVNKAKAFQLHGKVSGLNKTPNPLWLQYQSQISLKE